MPTLNALLLPLICAPGQSATFRSFLPSSSQGGSTQVQRIQKRQYGPLQKPYAVAKMLGHVRVVLNHD